MTFLSRVCPTCVPWLGAVLVLPRHVGATLLGLTLATSVVVMGYHAHGIETLGNGVRLLYGSPRVSTHPRRELGLNALGSSLGEFLSWMYHGLPC